MSDTMLARDRRQAAALYNSNEARIRSRVTTDLSIKRNYPIHFPWLQHG